MSAEESDARFAKAEKEWQPVLEQLQIGTAPSDPNLINTQLSSRSLLSQQAKLQQEQKEREEEESARIPSQRQLSNIDDGASAWDSQRELETWDSQRDISASPVCIFELPFLPSSPSLPPLPFLPPFPSSINHNYSS